MTTGKFTERLRQS